MNFKLKPSISRIKYTAKLKILIAAVLIVCILLSVFSYNRVVTDRVHEPVCREAKEKILIMIKGSIREFLEDRENFTDSCFTQSLTAGEKGSSYAINTEIVNLAEDEIVERIKEKLEHCSVISINIPIGSLMNNQFLSGKGFPVKVKVFMSTSISSSVSSSIESAGINQSLYRLILNIDVDGELIFPKGSEKFVVSTSAALGEKIIIGTVPLS